MNWRRATSLLALWTVAYAVVATFLYGAAFTVVGPELTGADFIVAISDHALFIVLSAVPSIQWHRMIILGERPTASDQLPWPILTRYILLGAVVALAALMPIMAAFHLPLNQSLRQWLPLAPEDADAALLLIAVVLIPVIFYIPVRLSLAYPAVAVDRFEVLGHDGWHLSNGCFWRLFWGSLLSAFVPFALAMAIYLACDLATRTGYVAANVLSGAITLVGSLVWIGFVSHAYRDITASSRA